jgi:hypothetical protein
VAPLSGAAAEVDAASAPEEVAPQGLSDTCEPGEQPAFTYGFATLSELLGQRMGQPLSCERTSALTGDSLQRTTRGLARYSLATNTPIFSSGAEHWALTSDGLVYWVGRSADVPGDAQIALAGGVSRPASEPPVSIAATPSPAVAAEAAPHRAADWLQRPLQLLAEYDRRHGTILDKVIENSNVVVLQLPGAWAAYVPKLRTITLDPVLQSESPEAVATVLAHEAQHAVDSKLNGRTRSDRDIMCYTWEISAFRLQAAVWQSFYGDHGKPNPATELEEELNEILLKARTDSWQLTTNIRERYRDQCL